MSFLTRIAAAAPVEDVESSGPSNLQLGAMGVAAASPFAGLIGQQPIIHDPLQGAKGIEFKNMQELARNAQHGDILLTSKPSGSMFKNFITPAGDSQFYHAQPVTGVVDGVGHTLSAGDLVGEKVGPRRALSQQHPIPAYFKNPETKYDSAILLRPKKPMTPEQMKAYQKDLGERVTRYYDNEKALGTFFRDLFVPKVDAIANLRPDTVCQGNVCSTMPAMSYHTATGRRVVPGKPAQDTFPTDFLRSTEYELVGHHISPGVHDVENKLIRKVSPIALRAGLGLGAAGGVYAATENPNLVGAGAGMVAANSALNKMAPTPADPTKWTEIPRFEELFGEMQSGRFQSREGKEALKKFFTRRVPGLLAGGAAGYGAMHLARKGLKHLKERSQKERSQKKRSQKER